MMKSWGVKAMLMIGGGKRIHFNDVISILKLPD